MLLSGLLAALLEASRSGKGQVIDAAMTDGVIALLSIFYSIRASDRSFRDETGQLMLAGSAPYYGTFETSDGKYLALGAIEPQFYALLIEKLGTGLFGDAARVRFTHNVARGSFVTVNGVEQHAPAPRFSRTAAAPVQAPHRAGADSGEVLAEAGFAAAEIEHPRASGGLA